MSAARAGRTGGEGLEGAWCVRHAGQASRGQRLASHLPSSPPPPPCRSDDDNDLQLAARVGRAYLPGITADSVRRAVAAAPDRFYVAASAGVFGAEECLRRLLADCAAGASVAPAPPAVTTGGRGA